MNLKSKATKKLFYILALPALLTTGCQKNLPPEAGLSDNEIAIQKVTFDGPKVLGPLEWTDLISKESIQKKFSKCDSLPQANNFYVTSKWKEECSFNIGSTRPSLSVHTLDSSDNLKEGTRPAHIQISFPSSEEYGKFVDAIWEKYRGEYIEGKRKASPVPGLWDSKSYGGQAANDYWRFYESCTETTCFVYQITTDDGDIDLSRQRNKVWAYPTRATNLYLYRNSDY
jgi:hypothetical protein|tara:strand:+ start:50 stop:733 length:684 start_codon:yes stop_codon:yes gene_type:complete